jgi:hypothetical protein
MNGLQTNRRGFHRAFLHMGLPLGVLAADGTRLQASADFEAGAAKRLITPDPLLPVSGGWEFRRLPSRSRAN